MIEDFVRNFLVKMGLKLTMHYFQSEWYVCWPVVFVLCDQQCFLNRYQLMAAGKLSDYHSESVPDVYFQ